MSEGETSARLEDRELGELTRTTLAHYEGSAEQFWLGTRDHDVSQNLGALVDAIGRPGPLRILDFGCGPGRDLLALKALGHDPVGLDGAEAFVALAREHTQVDHAQVDPAPVDQAPVEVWHQDFLALSLPSEDFDGVFANASLFHVPSQELPRVLAELHACLRPGGVLFSSNPRGNNEEGFRGERYCAYHDLERWTGFLVGAGFEEIRHYYRPEGLPRDQQPWLASLWRKSARG